MSNSILFRSVAAFLLVSSCGFDLESHDLADRRRGGDVAPKTDDANAGLPDPRPENSSSKEPSPGAASGDGSAFSAGESSGESSGPGNGGSSGDASELPTVDPNATSFSRHVLPILNGKCSECHHAGSAHTNFASFPFKASGMQTYVQAMLAMAKPGESSMPPGPRDALTDAEYAVLAKWFTDGINP